MTHGHGETEKIKINKQKKNFNILISLNKKNTIIQFSIIVYLKGLLHIGKLVKDSMDLKI
jgi:hypothetical protein